MFDVSFEELKKVTTEKIAELIILNRAGKIEIQPGYDGEYGVPVFSDEDKQEFEKIDISKNSNKQIGLGQFI